MATPPPAKTFSIERRRLLQRLQLPAMHLHATSSAAPMVQLVAQPLRHLHPHQALVLLVLLHVVLMSGAQFDHFAWRME